MTSTATHLPAGTRVRIADLAPDYDGLTAVVTGAGTGEWADWTAVAMDRRVSGNAGLLFRPRNLEVLPEPTVSLVKAERAQGQEAAAERLAQRCRHLEEMFVRSDQVMADQAQLIAEQKEALRIVRDHRDELAGNVAELKVQVSQLEARDLGQAEDRIAELEKALNQRNAQLSDTAEAAEAYRCELMEAKRVLRNIAELTDGALAD
jgi:multidrug efflux pump subunit AcrA (membrane-fusion protein)